jgi:hypothetical protein
MKIMEMNLQIKADFSLSDREKGFLEEFQKRSETQKRSRSQKIRNLKNI